MYNETYDEYIRSILGYPQIDNAYDNYNFVNENTFENINSRYDSNELESYYPEIYKIVYPMVQKKCNSNRNEISKETIEQMADEIFFAVEENNRIDLNIKLKNDVRTTDLDKNSSQNIGKTDVKIQANKENREVKLNNGLRDLIKILLIRELIGRPGNRPPFGPPPPRPHRPPFPGNRPPFGPRPPIRPRISDDYNIYEY